jgi:hypothetical protein
MKPNMSTMFLIHLPISVATLVPIRNAKWLPVEIRRKKKNRMTEYKFHHNIKSKRRLWNIMSIGIFIVIFVFKGMFIMIRGTNKRLQPKGLSTNNSREQNTKQESTETNQQQPTDITQQNHKRT